MSASLEYLGQNPESVLHKLITLCNHELFLRKTAIMRLQIKNARVKIFLCPWDLNHGSLESKASVLPINYTDPLPRRRYLLMIFNWKNCYPISQCKDKFLSNSK